MSPEDLVGIILLCEGLVVLSSVLFSLCVLSTFLRGFKA